jgi:hypothetical protein
MNETNTYSSRNRGSRPAFFIGTAKASAMKTFCVILTGLVCRNVFIFEIYVANASVENILHYFSTSKPQGRKPGFLMNMYLIN